MGITGLLPFLKNASQQVNVDEFKGCTVAVDTYCWLHKGAFSCADKLAMGEKTNGHVLYVMKLVNLLLSKKLKPIMVFDGCHLPSKAGVEHERRQRREQNKKKATQFLREGKRTEARECFQRCVDITPQMASDVMKACRAAGVDCLVAPYEADAQLAYLNKAGIAHLVITEDSDLIPFGCYRVLYKMDARGNGVLVEQERLNRCTQIQDSYYTFERFRQMCILSGCDYLTKIPGVGLVKANKLFKISSNPDIRQVLRKLPTILNLKTTVSEEFIEEFFKAENTFLYQLVFDPLKTKLVPLTPYPEGKGHKDYPYAGPSMSDERAYQIAIGNINIYTGNMMDNFDPTTYIPPRKDKSTLPVKSPPHMRSIWTKHYKIRPEHIQNESESRPTTKNMAVSAHFSLKRAREATDCEETETDNVLADLYSDLGSLEKENKRRKIDDDVSVRHSSQVSSTTAETTEVTSQEHKEDDDEDADENAINLLMYLGEKNERENDDDDKAVTQKKSSYFSPAVTESETRYALREVTHNPKNIFAVHKNEQKRERLDLNAVKSKPKPVFLKSRFFASKSPPDGEFKPVVKCDSPKVKSHARKFDVELPSMKNSKQTPDTARKGLNRLSAFSWAKTSAFKQEKSVLKESSRLLSSFDKIDNNESGTNNRSESEQGDLDADWEQLRAEILPGGGTKDSSVTEKNGGKLSDDNNHSSPAERKSRASESVRKVGSPHTKKRTLQDELTEIITGSRDDVRHKYKTSEEMSRSRSLGSVKDTRGYDTSRLKSRYSLGAKQTSDDNKIDDAVVDCEVTSQDGIPNEVMFDSGKEETGYKETSQKLRTSGSQKSLQDELCELVTGARKDIVETSATNKSRSQGCRKVGLSKKGRKTKTEPMTEHPKLTSFLSKFKNEKSSAKLRPTELIKVACVVPTVVDLTEDPEEVNYNSFVGTV